MGAVKSPSSARATCTTASVRCRLVTEGDAQTEPEDAAAAAEAAPVPDVAGAAPPAGSGRLSSAA